MNKASVLLGLVMLPHPISNLWIYTVSQSEGTKKKLRLLFYFCLLGFGVVYFEAWSLAAQIGPKIVAEAGLELLIFLPLPSECCVSFS